MLFRYPQECIQRVVHEVGFASILGPVMIEQRIATTPTIALQTRHNRATSPPPLPLRRPRRSHDYLLSARLI
jgi:hypothetical protein